MRCNGRVVVFLMLAPLCLRGQDRPDDLSKVPVKRVVLYKNGVGYFEHLGQVRDNQEVNIPFTSGQLNDVLKSLTVLDLNGGRISGVAYGSSSPVDRQLGELRLSAGEKGSLTDFLGALRGARLEVRSGTTVINGRLLSVERKTRIAGGTTLEVDYVSLLTDNGELRTTELSPAFSVRLLERGLSGKVDRYLDLASAGREADVRRMVVSTEGTGPRSLFVSYISEVPVWKATYRIVLGSKAGQGPLLQGWAIVDNTVGQDWENVQLSLVAGAPQSFIQNLSQPFYSRRPTVALPQSLNASPQTYEATLTIGSARITGVVTDPTGLPVAGATVNAYDPSGALVGHAITAPAGFYELSSLPEGSMRVQVDLAGFRPVIVEGIIVLNTRPAQQNVRLEVGNVSETVTVTAAAPSTVNTSTNSISGGSRSLGSGAGLGGSNYQARQFSVPSATPLRMTAAVDAARGRSEASAVAQELGDLFEYKLKEPITIRKNRSALVPIVQSDIGAEKVSVWNEQAGLRRPLRALWLTNSTGLTLDGGTFSVLEEETFAGEGVFEPIRPAEKRLVSYATDLAVNASSRNGSEQQRVTRCRVSGGVMIHESEVREKKTYTFRNEDASRRTVIVEHPARAGYELRSETAPAESTAGWMRFRLPVEPKQTASLVIEEARSIEASYTLSNITSDQIGVFLKQRSINKTVEDALRRILAQQGVVREIESQKSAREDETSKIFDDQQRLRENMKALKGSAEEKALLQRYTQQLNTQESRLEALKKESKQLEDQADAAQTELDRIVRELSFDVKL
jgi:hypothetical protein